MNPATPTHATPDVVVFWAKPPGHDDYRSVQLQDGGPEAQFSHVYPHDEGYSAVLETYTYAEGVVTLDRYEEGRDCDGPIHRESELVCHYSRLAANPADPKNGKARATPMWDEKKSVITDVYAQQMGY